MKSRHSLNSNGFNSSKSIAASSSTPKPIICDSSTTSIILKSVMSLYKSVIPSYNDMFLSPLSKVARDITCLVFRNIGRPAVEHITLIIRYSVPSFINAAGRVFAAFDFFFMGCLTISFNTRPLT